jgi:CcmD family protein
MIYLQDAPANTTAYMIAGYTVIFGLMLFYLISLIVRQRNLEQDSEMLESLEKKD